MLIFFTSNIVFTNMLYLRKKYYMSRKTLARLIGVSHYRLRDMEEGLVSPPAMPYESLKRVAQVFNVPLEALTNTDMCEVPKA